MLVPQLMLSVAVAISVSAMALLTGWGPLWALLIYSVSGSTTLALLAAWSFVRADV